MREKRSRARLGHSQHVGVWLTLTLSAKRWMVCAHRLLPFHWVSQCRVGWVHYVTPHTRWSFSTLAQTLLRWIVTTTLSVVEWGCLLAARVQLTAARACVIVRQSIVPCSRRNSIWAANTLFSAASKPCPQIQANGPFCGTLWSRRRRSGTCRQKPLHFTTRGSSTLAGSVSGDS